MVRILDSVGSGSVVRILDCCSNPSATVSMFGQFHSRHIASVHSVAEMSTLTMDSGGCVCACVHACVCMCNSSVAECFPEKSSGVVINRSARG